MGDGATEVVEANERDVETGGRAGELVEGNETGEEVGDRVTAGSPREYVYTADAATTSTVRHAQSREAPAADETDRKADDEKERADDAPDEAADAEKK
jgi:hypothetical protein